jgi:serine phosphatase RsbU (regulator of sigma subunit)
MSQMKGVFHSLAQMDLNPQEFLGRANEALGRCLERTSFITLSYFVVDTESRTVQFSRAGHCPSLYYNESQGKVDFMKSKGLGLGIIRSMEYYKYIEVNELKYNSGDILVMYTDGITEAKNPLNEEFGYERLQMIVQEHVKKSASEIQKAIISGLHDFTQLEEIQDDFTAMIIRFR